MSFKISLFFNNFLGILRDISVLCVVDFRKITLSSVGPCLETLENVSSMTLLANVFFLRHLSTDLVLLAFGDQYKSILLGHC